jgi:hypothetical protein
MPAAPRPNEVRWTDELADELHKQIGRHFRKRRVLVRGIDEVWAVDLIDMQHYAKDNDKCKYILAVIDMFSKFGYMRVLKQRTGIEVAHALNDIIMSSGRKPATAHGVTRGPKSTTSMLRN